VTYERFEDLPVWKDAAELSARIFDFTDSNRFKGKGDIANQIQRAGLSVPNNISEGFERGTTNDLVTFIYYARGSAGEVRSILLVMKRIAAFEGMHREIDVFVKRAEGISRQLRAWANTLQNSDIAGQRYLNEGSRRGYEKKHRQKGLLEQLKLDQTERLERIKKQREGE
jgi:four helix bundle protein